MLHLRAGFRLKGGLPGPRPIIIGGHNGFIYMFIPEFLIDPGPPRNFAKADAKTFLVILGSGHPEPNPYRYGPATALIVNDTPYLIDAGEGVSRAVARAASFHGGAISKGLSYMKLKKRDPLNSNWNQRMKYC